MMSYWDGNGRHQEVAEELFKLIPSSGHVDAPALDKLRRAQNAYYDWLNNGLWNEGMPEQFAEILGFLPPKDDDEESDQYTASDKDIKRADRVLDRLILAAQREQQ